MTPAPISNLNRIQETMWEICKAGRLPIWTVYDRPREYRDAFVARLHGRAMMAVKKAGCRVN